MKGEQLKLDDLYKFPEPEVPFDMKEPALYEIKELLKKTRSKSAPGPNGIPYKLYKNCPGVSLSHKIYVVDLQRFVENQHSTTELERSRRMSLAKS